MKNSNRSIFRRSVSLFSMRLRHFLVFLCLFTPMIASARYAPGIYMEEVKPFTGGPLAGLNLTQVDGDMYFGYSKPGLTIGGFVRAHFTERISASMELLFSQKGSKGVAEVDDPFLGKFTARCNIGLNYVEVPVTVRYEVAGIGGELGMSYSRLVGAKEWILSQPLVPIDAEKNRFEENGLDYILGVSKRLNKHVQLNARFQYSAISIRPFSRVPAGYAWGEKGQFNNLFSIRVVYEL